MLPGLTPPDARATVEAAGSRGEWGQKHGTPQTKIDPPAVRPRFPLVIGGDGSVSILHSGTF